MSNDTQVQGATRTVGATTEAATLPNHPKNKRAPRKQTVEHSAAIAAYAKAKKIDTTRAGKLFRAKLRANTDAYKKNGGKPHVKNAPWGAHPRKALAAIFPDVPTFKG